MVTGPFAYGTWYSGSVGVSGEPCISISVVFFPVSLFRVSHSSGCTRQEYELMGAGDDLVGSRRGGHVSLLFAVWGPPRERQSGHGPRHLGRELRDRNVQATRT